MRTYSCFIVDSRYSAPTLSFLFAEDEAAARVIARRRLLESDHHIAVEVHEDGRELFRETREAPDLARAG